MSSFPSIVAVISLFFLYLIFIKTGLGEANLRRAAERDLLRTVTCEFSECLCPILQLCACTYVSTFDGGRVDDIVVNPTISLPM